MKKDKLLAQELAIKQIIVESCCHILGGKHEAKHRVQAEEIRKYYKKAIQKDYIEKSKVVEARINENESLLSVTEHEIELGDKCYNHEKHTPQCYACRKRKMYVEYSKDWKRVIKVRIKQLKTQLGLEE